MNSKLKKSFSIALSMLAVGGISVPVYADGKMDNYRLLNTALYVKDPKKLKLLSIVSKKARMVVETLKINTFPIKNKEDINLFPGIETLDVYGDGFRPDLKNVIKKSEDSNEKCCFDFEKVLGKHGKKVKVINFRRGTFTFKDLTEFLKSCGSTLKKEVVTKKNEINFEVIITDNDERKIKFDVAYGYGDYVPGKLDLNYCKRSEPSLYVELVKKIQEMEIPNSAYLNRFNIYAYRYLDFSKGRFENIPSEDVGSKTGDELLVDIPYGAFLINSCERPFLVVPGNVSVIRENSLTNGFNEPIKCECIKVSEGVKYIKKNAFNEYLQVVYIPDSAVVDYRAFDKCSDSLEINYKGKKYNKTEFKKLIEGNILESSRGVTKVSKKYYDIVETTRTIESGEQINIPSYQEVELDESKCIDFKTLVQQLDVRGVRFGKKKSSEFFNKAAYFVEDKRCGIQRFSDRLKEEGAKFYYEPGVVLKILIFGREVSITPLDSKTSLWKKLLVIFNLLDSSGFDSNLENIIEINNITDYFISRDR